MAKINSQAQTAEDEKLEAQRTQRRIDAAESTNADLDEALDDSFPASDPPSMTQPEKAGAPSGDRKPAVKPDQKK